MAAVTVIDGDPAGTKIRKELQGFFSGRGEFQANRDFVSVRTGYEMEGMFPDAWIAECHDLHPAWFDSWSLDSMNNIEPFSIKDGKKENFAKYMHSKVQEISSPDDVPDELRDRFFNLFIVIDEALESQLLKLSEGGSV